MAMQEAKSSYVLSFTLSPGQVLGVRVRYDIPLVSVDREKVLMGARSLLYEILLSRGTMETTLEIRMQIN